MAHEKRSTSPRIGIRGSTFGEAGRAGFGKAHAKDYPPIFETAKRTRLLVAVAVNEPVSLHELCYIMGIGKGAAHPAIAHCERLGIVVRRNLAEPAPSEFLLRGRYCLNQRHPLYGDVRTLLLALDAAKPIGRVRRSGIGPLGEVVRCRNNKGLDYLFGQPCRTRALAFVSILGTVDAPLYQCLWGMSRDTVRKSLELMKLTGFLSSKVVVGIGSGAVPTRRKFMTYSLNSGLPALDELKGLVGSFVRLKPQYGVLASEATKMRSYLRDQAADHEPFADRV